MARGPQIQPNEAKLVLSLIPNLRRVHLKQIQVSIKKTYSADVPLQRIRSVVALLNELGMVDRKGKKGVLRVAPEGVDVTTAVERHYKHKRAAKAKRRAAKAFATTKPTPPAQSVPAPAQVAPKDQFNGVMIVHSNMISQSIRTQNYRLFALDENGVAVEVGEGEVKLPDPRGWFRRLFGF